MRKTFLNYMINTYNLTNIHSSDLVFKEVLVCKRRSCIPDLNTVILQVLKMGRLR